MSHRANEPRPERDGFTYERLDRGHPEGDLGPELQMVLICRAQSAGCSLEFTGSCAIASSWRGMLHLQSEEGTLNDCPFAAFLNTVC
eukprot:3248042-Rhodomonas_salina.2